MYCEFLHPTLKAKPPWHWYGSTDDDDDNTQHEGTEIPSHKKNKKKHALQDVQADAPQLVDIRMINFRHEANLGRGHRVFLREEQLQFENPAFEWTLKIRQACVVVAA